MKTLISNIKQLLLTDESPQRFVAGADMAQLSTLNDAYLIIDDDKITDYGKMSELSEANFDKTIDASDSLVMPAFCDPHTHIVFPETREIEYIDKIKGLSYEEIAKRGGGILNSARKIIEKSEDDLYESAMQRLNEIASYGTGAVEIKSGYGLTTEGELKMLRVIKRLKEDSPLTIKANFLGAHAVPPEYKQNQGKYVDLIINEMIPAVAKENLADYIDVFCDRGFFTVEETERILEAGAKYELVPKIHANELDYSGGIQTGVKHNALSVDHLEYTGDEEIAVLKDSATMPTLLPGASFFLELIYAPARKMIIAGLPIAMASDFNPGSSPSGNMQFILSLGSIKYRLLPEESINAITHNAAYAMGVENELGTITRGKKANLIITKNIPNYEFLPYYYGANKVKQTIIEGKTIVNNEKNH
ncbi:MAG: imidazolonepropionase [Bacteroidales bacterium]|nr:imidazolonepropionase [Bacteroidales bacterium]